MEKLSKKPDRGRQLLVAAISGNLILNGVAVTDSFAAAPAHIRHPLPTATAEAPLPRLAVRTPAVQVTGRRHDAKAKLLDNANLRIVGHASHPAKYYWLGPDSVWKEMDSSAQHNAVLAFMLATKEPWFSRTEIQCLDALWTQESGFRTHDPNPESEADGVPQANPASKMASAGPDYQNNPITQEKWGLSYIDDRYKTACAAEAQEQTDGYY